MTDPSTNLTAYVICPPGLEQLVAREMTDLGIRPDYRGPTTPGGLTCRVDLRDLYRLNLHLAVASRVLVRLGTFPAATMDELIAVTQGIPWRSWFMPSTIVEVVAESHGSKLYHQTAIAERVNGVLVEQLGTPDDDTAPPTQRVYVRVVKDKAQFSLDASGEHLHRRGYRQEVGKAPLRETLAAGLIMASGWDRRSPLVDPFCGSGTLPIEAARMARNIPPGWDRDFAFNQWRGFQAEVWADLRARAEAARTDGAADIFASDRDAGAVRATEANAERAGVADAITVACAPLSRAPFPPGSGWVITNPPYGARVGGAELRDLYAALGNRIRAEAESWRVAMLSASREMQSYTGLPFRLAAKCRNGGIPVAMVVSPE